MTQLLFKNRDHEYVQVNTRMGSTTKNFGLKNGDSELIDTTAPLLYAWLDANDTILENEFDEAATAPSAAQIIFGMPDGKVLRDDS